MSQQIEYQGEKFKEFVKNYKVIDEETKLYRRIKIEEVADMLDVSRNQVYKYFNSKALDDKIVVRIMSEFEVGVEDIWGEEYNPTLVSKPKQEVTAVPMDAYMMVEYVDLAASAGALGLTNIEMLPETKLRLVPKEYERGNYLVVRVNGDSMVDGTDISIPDGTEILVKEYVLSPGERLPIRGNLFVVSSSEGNVFKQITEHNIEEGYIRCHSYNPRYDDYIISLKEIYNIFIFRKIVSYRPNIPEIK